MSDQQPTNAAPAAPISTTDDSFEADVLNSDIPVLVDFWAEWCGPCKMIAPLLDDIAAEYAGKVKIAKVNIDENPKLPQQYHVRGIPALILIKDGQVQSQSAGVVSKAKLIATLENAL